MRTRAGRARPTFAGRCLVSRSGRLLLVVAVVAGVSAGVGVATGAIPGGDGRISACYSKIGGAVRVIDAERGQACKPSEESISWNQQGPPGPQGEPGPGARPALWAIVRGADGNLFKGSHVATTVRNHQGSYSIVFDELIPGQSGDRPGCAVNVTPTNLEGDFTTHTGVTPITYAGSATTIHIETWQDASKVDQSFALAVSC